MTHSRRPVALTATPDLGARLLARSVRTDTGCLEWTGSRDRSGYGWIRVGHGRANAKTVKTHRASFAAFVRPIEDGEEICHSCDNPPCLEPSHLRAGDHQSNIAEMIDRGRRRPDSVAPKGENHPAAKLTADQVREIRARRASGEKYDALVAAFGVTKTTISEICTRKTWRDLPD